jgi:hypothetical protein
MTATRTLVLALSLFGAATANAATPDAIDAAVDAHYTQLPMTPANAKAVNDRCASTLALVDRARKALESRTGPATIEGDFAAFDTLQIAQTDGYFEMGTLSETHPDKAVRDAAEACAQKLADAGTAISLSRPIYDRLAAIDAKPLDDKTRFALTKMLTNYRLAGVDRDTATRERIADLQKQITESGLVFARNIREDKGDITLKPEALAGLAAGLPGCAQAPRRRPGAPDLRLPGRAAGAEVRQRARYAAPGNGGLPQSRLSRQRRRAQALAGTAIRTGPGARPARLRHGSHGRQDDRQSATRGDVPGRRQRLPPSRGRCRLR